MRGSNPCAAGKRSISNVSMDRLVKADTCSTVKEDMMGKVEFWVVRGYEDALTG